MKNLYPEYRKKTVEEVKEIFKEAIIYLDTNVLINIYFHSKNKQNIILELFEELSSLDKIYLPNHVVFEYTRQRLQKIEDLKKVYVNTSSQIDKLINDINCETHPFISDSNLYDQANEVLNKLKLNLDESISSIRDMFNVDVIYEKLCTIFESKVLKSFTESELNEIYLEGEERYKKKTLPGYKDRDKPDNKYGDFVIWKEMIRNAKEKNKPIVFVTEDNKENWVYEIGGEKMGVDPKMQKEVSYDANVNIIIYSTSQLLKYGSKNEVDNSIIKELDDESIYIKNRIKETENSCKQMQKEIESLEKEKDNLFDLLSLRNDGSERHYVERRTMEIIDRISFLNEQIDGEQLSLYRYFSSI